MTTPSLTPEQSEHLERHIAGIGHNQGPALVEHADEILERVAGHHRLKSELTAIRVMLDMLRSHLKAEYVLPKVTAGYVTACVAFASVITGLSIVTAPVSTVLADAVVVSLIVATLHGEIDQYVDWRIARDPSYRTVKAALHQQPR
jgi:hypothetical protein